MRTAPHHPGMPAPLLRARDKLRTLHRDVPSYACDAFLSLAAALTEAAIYCEARAHRGAADGFRDIAAEARRLAGQAEQRAAIFAPPREDMP
jgi:hypothetical protein